MMGMSETVEEAAAKWGVIRAAWEAYSEKGAGAFDWDYDSRDVMEALTVSTSDGELALAKALAVADVLPTRVAATRLAALQVRADELLDGCCRAFVPLAQASIAEQGSPCYVCGGAPDVRIEMRAREDMEAPYGDVAAGTAMFWANACPHHHDEPVSVTLA